jgi:hypothetical protein
VKEEPESHGIGLPPCPQLAGSIDRPVQPVSARRGYLPAAVIKIGLSDIKNGAVRHRFYVNKFKKQHRALLDVTYF